MTAPPAKLAIVEEVPSGKQQTAKALHGGTRPVGRREHTYGDLQRDLRALAAQLPCPPPSAERRRRGDTGEGNCLLLSPPSYGFVAGLLAAWARGYAAVPTCDAHVFDELSYFAAHSGAAAMLFDPVLAANKFPAAYLESEWAVLGAENSGGAGLFVAASKHRKSSDGACVTKDVAAATPGSGDALIVYTSGTTAKPKGVVHTHASVGNQVAVLQDAWAWSANDTILNPLPLHHVHGLVNVLLCALASQATCVLTPFDDAGRIARRLAAGDVTLFMGVPTMYHKMAAAVSLWPNATVATIDAPNNKNNNSGAASQGVWRDAVSKHVRLMVCGSAALPPPLLASWRDLSGHLLLERYGMTEVGMALGQPRTPERRRLAGTVGAPFATVDACVVAPAAAAATPPTDAASATAPAAIDPSPVGELWLRSGSMFDRYWNNPAATAESFLEGPIPPGTVYATSGGRIPDSSSGSGNNNGSSDPTLPSRWFATGDTVGVRTSSDADGSFDVLAILGRTSVDIIKRAGYKLSALEMEAELLDHPAGIVAEVAVVGVADEEKGERAVAVVAPKQAACPALFAETPGGNNSPSLRLDASHPEAAKVDADLRAWASLRLAKYKQPSSYVLVRSLPRNAMGKVNKKDLKRVLGL